MVRFRLWCSHSLIRVRSQLLSWYLQPQGNVTTPEFSVAFLFSGMAVTTIVHSVV
jgi:hypothetical protein